MPPARMQRDAELLDALGMTPQRERPVAAAEGHATRDDELLRALGVEPPAPAGRTAPAPGQGYEVEVVGSGPPGTFARQAPGGTPQLEPPETPPMARPPGVSPMQMPQPGGPRSPALAAEQAQAQQQPWGMRTLKELSAASPEFALSAPDLPQIEQAVSEMTPEERAEFRRREGQEWLGLGKTGVATGTSTSATLGGARAGFAVGSRFGPIPAAIGAGLGAVGGSLLARRTNVALGVEEEGKLGDVLSVALPASQALYPVGKAALRSVVAKSRGWQAVKAADEATAAGQKAYQEAVEAVPQQRREQQARLQGGQQEREARFQQRRQEQLDRAAARHQRQETGRAQTVAEQEATAIQEAADRTSKQAREYAEQRARYDTAVASQTKAVGEARAIAPRYKPETPAKVIYDKLAAIAPHAPVTIPKTQAAAAELHDVLEQLPSLTPSRLQTLLTDIRSARSTQSVRSVQRFLTDLGKLTRSPDSKIRRSVKPIYGALLDDLGDSAALLPGTDTARDLLLKARGTWRQEMGVRDLARLIRRSIKVGDDGIARVRPGMALSKFDELMEEDTLFAGSLPPETWQEVRGWLEQLTTAQKIPPRPGGAPPPVTPKTVAPFQPTPFVEPPPPTRQAPYSQWEPPVEAPPPPEPVLPQLDKREQGLVRQVLTAGARAVTPAGVRQYVPGLGKMRGDMADAIADFIVNPNTRQRAQNLLNYDGSINEAALRALVGGRGAVMADRE